MSNDVLRFHVFVLPNDDTQWRLGGWLELPIAAEHRDAILADVQSLDLTNVRLLLDGPVPEPEPAWVCSDHGVAWMECECDTGVGVPAPEPATPVRTRIETAEDGDPIIVVLSSACPTCGSNEPTMKWAPCAYEGSAHHEPSDLWHVGPPRKGHAVRPEAIREADPVCGVCDGPRDNPWLIHDDRSPSVQALIRCTNSWHTVTQPEETQR